MTATAREIADNYDDAKKNFQDVRIAGRIMSRRIMGSASFFELQDHTGRIQVYIRRDDICPGRRSDALQHGFQETARHRRLHRRGRIRLPYQHRRTVGALPLSSPCCRSRSARCPSSKEKDGKTFDAFTDPESALPPAVFGPDRQPAGEGDLRPPRARIMATMREFFNERGATSRSRPRSSSPSPAAHRRVRSSPTTTRSTSTSTCASPRNFTSRN